MHKYSCNICGYVYDEMLGDEIMDIKPKTPFPDVPVTYICPVCNAKKGAFIKVCD